MKELSGILNVHNDNQSAPTGSSIQTESQEESKNTLTPSMIKSKLSNGSENHKKISGFKNIDVTHGHSRVPEESKAGEL